MGRLKKYYNSEDKKQANKVAAKKYYDKKVKNKLHFRGIEHNISSKDNVGLDVASDFQLTAFSIVEHPDPLYKITDDNRELLQSYMDKPLDMSNYSIGTISMSVSASL